MGPFVNPIGTSKADHLPRSSLGCGWSGAYSDAYGSSFRYFANGQAYGFPYWADCDGENGFGSGFVYEDEDCNGFGYGSETGTELDDASGFGTGYDTTSPNRMRRAE